MILRSIGIIHFVHSPILIVLPFFINNREYDIIYINYFFLIMFLYTFINGECPISYVCKIIQNRNYIAGDDITYYPEIEYIFKYPQHIQYFFGITTTAYLATLTRVIFRANIPVFLIYPPMLLLGLYFAAFRSNFRNKYRRLFLRFQQITRYTIFITILGIGIYCVVNVY